MKTGAIGCALILAWVPLQASAKDSLCGPLRAFVASVKPDETRSLAFRTNWGGRFKDDADADQFTLYSKRCEHNDYGPAQAVCASLMADGAVEFSDNNFKEALQCLSRKTRLRGGLWFDNASVSLTYGTHDRGANVDLEYVEDLAVGGMVLKVTAHGY